MAQLYYKSGSSWVNALSVFYPVGAYYLSNSSSSPSSLFGGTWQSVTSRFLYCSSSITTGGANSQTLTAEQLPKHTHRTKVGWSSGGSGINCLSYNSGTGDSWGGFVGLYDSSTGNIAKPNGSIITAATQAVNNMPQYRTCFAWYRTA